MAIGEFKVGCVKAPQNLLKHPRSITFNKMSLGDATSASTEHSQLLPLTEALQCTEQECFHLKAFHL